MKYFLPIASITTTLLFAACGAPSLEQMRGCTVGYAESEGEHEIDFECPGDKIFNDPLAFEILIEDAPFVKEEYVWRLNTNDDNFEGQVVFEDKSHRLLFEYSRRSLVSDDANRPRLLKPEGGLDEPFKRFSICLDPSDEQRITPLFGQDIILPCFFMSEK